ncbi:hypothetical protein [Actinoplanes sp. URMC 104]|uniref:hypothetical protein n=1 Tax=Actinoplanes sp. URMC 104 TaxID=3423409 RepID=UPI003F1BD79C
MPELVGRLLERCDETARELSAAPWTLPPGTVHPGNLLRTSAGRVVLCDLQLASYLLLRPPAGPPPPS